MISEKEDYLSVSKIRFYLNDDSLAYHLTVLGTIDSTNQEAKRLLAAGGGSSLIILANQQSQGRGRRGRDFFSPQATGLYLSMVLPPRQGPKEAQLATVAAAVATARAIKQITKIDVAIKWVNDLYYQDRKIAGILTEGVISIESGRLSHLIVGIGLNVSQPRKGFPQALNGRAGALFLEKPPSVSRNHLAAEIVNQVLAIFKKPADLSYLDEYRKRSMVIGKAIDIISKDQTIKARVLGIDQAGGLMVERENGVFETLYSGEISIRKREKE